jgi:hypothetical protein
VSSDIEEACVIVVIVVPRDGYVVSLLEFFEAFFVFSDYVTGEVCGDCI